MTIPATHKDKRMLASGAGLALVMGVMLGAAMQPNLAADDRPIGPQIILGKAALHSTGPFDPGPELASYRGKVPDYVLGTDWARGTTPQFQLAAVSPPAKRPSSDADRDDLRDEARNEDRNADRYEGRSDDRYEPRYEPRREARYDPRDDEPAPMVYSRYADQDEPPPPRPRRWRYPSLGDEVRIRPPVERDYEGDDDGPSDVGR